MKTPLRVLIVEDSDDDVQLLLRELRRGGFVPAYERVDTAEAMDAALDRPWDVVISDHNMPRFSADNALKVLQRKGIDLPFIILSGSIGEELAVSAMKAGANDYITKGKLARLVPAVEREIRECRNRASRKRTEEQLRQSQKMDAIGQLSGGIAHDFNNFLSVILGYSDFALSTLRSGGKPETLIDDVGEIKAAAMRAAALTRQLLAFSRRQILEPVVMSLNQSVSGMEKMLQRLIGSNIELRATLAPDLAPVKADPGQIEQIILNLTINARDAMPAGGKLLIETRNVVLSEPLLSDGVSVPPGKYALLVAADTGHGMDAETQRRIFEPFFTTKEKGKGTGLGLSTVYGIVKQSAGFIFVNSEPGRGARFSIYLPQVDAPIDAPAAAEAPVAAEGKGVILLVEDEESVRTMIAKFLKPNGYTVIEAASGDEALAKCGAIDRIDLLITDIVMPGMTGFELRDRLKGPCSDAKVLFISGYTDHAIFRTGLPELKNRFLAKPFTADTLIAKVREVLSERNDEPGANR